MTGAYYNEIEPYCVAWLRNLIAAGILPAGDVDARPIQEVTHDDLTPYTQAHFFAGLGGWPYAARLAGWSDARPLWTGSCPCQPFSVAGRRAGIADDRHLWPHFHRVIRGGRPPVVMGEQVAGKLGYGWFDGVAADLETEGYTIRALDIPACSVNAPHIRNRLYWLAHPARTRGRTGVREASAIEYGHGPGGDCWRASGMADSHGAGLSIPEQRGFAGAPQCELDARATIAKCGSGSDSRVAVELWQPLGEDGLAYRSGAGNWDEWFLVGPDLKGKYRRLKPGTKLVAHGLPARIPRLRALGNSIVPPLAVEVIRAYMEAM